MKATGFSETRKLHLYPEDWGTGFLRNVGTYQTAEVSNLPIHTKWAVTDVKL
jgi:hypothetical protein